MYETSYALTKADDFIVPHDVKLNKHSANLTQEKARTVWVLGLLAYTRLERRWCTSNVWAAYSDSAKLYRYSTFLVYGAGLKPDDMTKPLIGVASIWWEGEDTHIECLSFNLFMFTRQSL
jgi:hypothetical protein